MDSTALLSVVGGALLLSIIFVTSLCVDCWGRKQPTSIHQRSSDSSPEYNSTSGFMDAPHLDHHRFQTMPYPLPNSLSSPSITVEKRPSYPPSETGSQASYVNQNDEPFQPTDEPDNYITVIPDCPSRTSSQSSGANYINIVKEDGNESACDECDNRDDDSDSGDYENLKDNLNNPDLGHQTPAVSFGSIDSSSDYVNTDPNPQ
ncbi:linker for activation of T-cells family member 1 isoform X2 [Myxocyprinus asiaticus]|uniref:linker for activation of T-cells family member 1 isoform X2 n=1 Tax=Myxocyprinus asiaticus TaxID=70543 RepID=UPI002222CE0A|nr:linker for activation of T-cells family member 1 isoform X2 [Myxocyprinus asiaticus]